MAVDLLQAAGRPCDLPLTAMVPAVIWKLPGDPGLKSVVPSAPFGPITACRSPKDAEIDPADDSGGGQNSCGRREFDGRLNKFEAAHRCTRLPLGIFHQAIPSQTECAPRARSQSAPHPRAASAITRAAAMWCRS